MSLSEWLADGSVKALPSSGTEIVRLLAIVDRSLADANVPGLSADRQFAIAYEAALQLATMVIRACGYRTSSSSSGHHWRTLSLLPELMGTGQRERRRYLDSCRRARNQADYDRVGAISEADLLELLEDTLSFRAEVLEWLGENHPDLE